MERESKSVERFRECFLSALRLRSSIYVPTFWLWALSLMTKESFLFGFLANMVLVCFLLHTPSPMLPKPGRRGAHFCLFSQPNHLIEVKQTNQQQKQQQKPTFICLNRQKGGNREGKQMFMGKKSQNRGWGNESVN